MNIISKTQQYIKDKNIYAFFRSFGSSILLLIFFVILAVLANKVHGPEWLLVTILFTIYAGLIITSYLFLRRPVERDRFLFANHGWSMALYSFFIIADLLCFIYTIAVILGISPDQVYSNVGEEEEHSGQLLWNIICQFADPGNLPQSLKKGTLIALISAMAGIMCLSGLILSSLVNWISLRAQKWRQGQIQYHGLKNYVVIIGVNEQTATIVRSSIQSGVDYVLIQTSKNVERERAKLELKLDRSDSEKLVFYFGERTLDEDVHKLRIDKAREVYILGEDMHSVNEDDHDSFNMTCLEIISNYMKGFPKRRIRCHVNFEYQSTFAVFKATHIYRSLNDDRIDFIPFNLHEIWAKKVLVDNYAILPVGKYAEKKVIRYAPLDSFSNQEGLGYIQENSAKTVHLVVVGMNQMGVALAMQAALLVHLPNYEKEKSRNLRTTITFIDNNAMREGEYLMGRYQALFALCRHRTIICSQDTFVKDDCLNNGNAYNIMWQHKSYQNADAKWCNWADPMTDGPYAYLGDNFMDLQWEFIEGNIASSDVQNYLSKLSADLEHRTCTIAVCLNNPQQSIATALYLPETVLKRALQILVYQQNVMDMIDKVSNSEKEWKRYQKLKPFGVIEGSYTGGGFDNTLAMFGNIIYDGDSKIPDEEVSGNEYDTDFMKYCFRARRLWNELGIVYKMANINLADSFNLKLRSAGNTDEDIKSALNDPETVKYLGFAEHNRWMTERLTMGYRPLYAEEKEKLQIAEGQGEYVFSKLYFKDKSRAHLDICSNEAIKECDKKVFEKGNDAKLIRMIPSFLKWQQKAIINNVLASGSVNAFNNDNLCMIPVSSYWISKNPVTAGQWKAVMGYYPPKMSTIVSDNDYVTNVSWNDIQDFLDVLRKKSDLRFDLPSTEELKTAFKKCKSIHGGTDGKLWQWTRTCSAEYKNNYEIYGSNKVISNKNGNFWFQDFKSSDLGFRLILPCLYSDQTDKILYYKLGNDDYKTIRYDYDKDGIKFSEDDDKVIVDLINNSLVEIDCNDKERGSFFILNSPVTQRQWKAVMRSTIRKGEELNPSENRGDYYPVENVSYNDAKLYCERLTDRVTALLADYKQKDGLKFRLPNKTEWLLAAKSDKTVKEVYWHSEMARSTHLIKRPADKDKIYDMLGNVWEWCDKEKADSTKVMMGGSWRLTKAEILKEDSFEIAEKYWLPDYKADDLGFRIIMEDTMGAIDSSQLEQIKKYLKDKLKLAN